MKGLVNWTSQEENRCSRPYNYSQHRRLGRTKRLGGGLPRSEQEMNKRRFLWLAAPKFTIGLDHC